VYFRPLSTLSFNSSVGILVVRTINHSLAALLSAVVSIPRSEFWSFGRLRSSRLSASIFRVSIPRSEFWSFGHGKDYG